jgi:hypothetical protein
LVEPRSARGAEPRGACEVALPTGTLRLIGGPFETLPPGAFSVCLEMRAANAWLADVQLPTADFGLPEPAALREALARTLAAWREQPERPVFIGCRAGIGRTGLFMACLIREAGFAGDALAEVRARYHPHAAETPEQERVARGV